MKKKEERGVFLERAREACAIAGKIQLKHLGKLKGYELKGVANLVTEVDLECERAVIDFLRSHFPEHKFLCEEGGGASLDSEWVWVIDPLDGTTNYAHSYPKFCVSIALVSYGKPVLGVVWDPILREEFSVIVERGAYLNQKRIEVSKVSRIEDSLLCTGFAYDRGLRLGKSLKVFEKVLPYPQSVRRDGCAALNLCYVACGRFDGFWEHHLNPWDIAAGVLLVKEAGGRVSDLSGNEITLDRDEIWVSNGLIHDEFLKILNEEVGLSEKKEG